MNYEKIYNDLIAKAKSDEANRTKLTGYFEDHHILPKSLGGSNRKSNIVRLTAREHFIAHALLIRFLNGEDLNKMRWAFHQICTWSTNSKSHKVHYINSRIYSNFKLNFQKGKDNSQFGKQWWYNYKTGDVVKSNTRPSEDFINGRKPKEFTKNYKIKIERSNKRVKYSRLSLKDFDDRVQLILKSGIDLTKFGWVNQVSIKTGLSRRQINLLSNESEILRNIVYYR